MVFSCHVLGDFRSKAKQFCIPLFSLCFLSVASMGAAAPAIFFDRASFNAAAGGGLDFESFESFTPGPTVFLDDFTVSETNGSNNLFRVTDFPAFFPASSVTDGNEAIGYQDNGTSVGAFFDFDTPINAFGVDITTNENVTIVIGGGANTTLNLVDGVPQFFGVIDLDATISSVTFNSQATADVGLGIAFDAASYGIAVPEPGTICVGVLGLMVVGGSGRRRIE